MSEDKLITGRDYKRMLMGAYCELLVEYESIDSMRDTGRYFYSGLPGTDVLRTLGAAIMPLTDAVNESIGGLSRRVADAAVVGARGNAGVIMAQMLRGIAKGLTGKYNANSSEFGKAFQYGILYAQRAVPDDGDARHIIVVAKEVAKGTYKAVREGLPIQEILKRALEASHEVNSDGEFSVTDAGQQIMHVFLAGCRKGLHENFVLPDIMFDNAFYLSHGLRSPAEEQVKPYCITFMVDNQWMPVETVDREMREVGNFVVVERRHKFIHVHMHTSNPGKVMERAVGWGHIGEIRINNMSEQHAMAAVQASLMPLALMTVADSREMGQKLQDAGATVIVDGTDTSGPSVEELVNAAHSDIARNYIFLTDHERLRLVAYQTQRILGDRVKLVLARNHEEQLQAARAFFPELTMEENQENMQRAVDMMKGRL